MPQTDLQVQRSSATDAPGATDPNLTDVGAAREAPPADSYVLARLRRGKAVVLRHEPRWRELWAHFDGDQFTEVSAVDGSVQRVETREGGPAKPRWRSRLIRNRFTKGIMGEVSVVGSRVPAFGVDPESADPQAMNAARMGEKLLGFFIGHFGIRRLTFRILTIAAVTGDGYAWPVWNPMLGSPLTGPDGGPLVGGKRTGDIEIHPLRQDQVMWQPGVQFEMSRWHAIRVAKPVEDLKAVPGFIGPTQLAADAASSFMDNRDTDGRADLVFLYHYLERPTPKYPDGRWLQIAGDHLAFKEEAYPCKEDIPVVHRMPWIERPNRDRSMGLGELAIDTQRSINRILNQLVTWRNLVLNPQVFAPENSLKTKLTDEPGKVFEYRPTGGGVPKWRETPEIPVSLFKELDQAYADIDYLCGGGPSLPPGVESGTGIQEFNEREMSFRSMVVSGLSQFYASLGLHLLYLAAEHYTEDRLIRVQGRFGVDLIPDFRGEMLKGVASVRVSEASITPRTRAQQEAKILMFADKGWIDPHAAMAALSGGTAESILDAFELHIDKAHRQIQALVDWGKKPVGTAMVPQDAGPMDNHAIHMDVLGQWMTTVDYERQPEAVKQMALAIFEQHQLESQTDSALAAQQTSAQAEGIGMGNAGSAPASKPLPSRPSVANEAAALTAGG